MAKRELVAIAIVLGVGATAAWAQENDPVAYSVAAKQDACDGRQIEKAYFIEPKRIAVECETDEGAAILLGGAGAAVGGAGSGALAAGSLVLLGAFASGKGDGIGSTASTGSTTGTN
ncbi:hypothetical protein [Tropicimonas marinistellae]|uniref:hypothetical protein n=1 Tax=Tropicimonas marinistellae TaxID=1739787 RepID=UPI0008372A99|nr:hypothetical protein [Tropicimonas marinistellae]